MKRIIGLFLALLFVVYSGYAYSWQQGSGWGQEFSARSLIVCADTASRSATNVCSIDGTTFGTVTGDGWTMPRAGCITGISAYTQITTATAGSMMFTASIDSVVQSTYQLTFPATAGTGHFNKAVTIPMGQFCFASEDSIQMYTVESAGGTMVWDETIGAVEVSFY